MDLQLFLDSIRDTLVRLDVRLFRLGDADVTLVSLSKLLLLLVLLFWLAAWARKWLIDRALVRLDLDLGTRQAIGSVARYLVLILGVLLILQNAGINLTALSVVAGAVGVGVGFGLQNIVSNFISGLIIMFERPIKVGDRVEVGAVEGTVQEISARRTTIVTGDNVAILIPNQRFILDNVVNLGYLGGPVRLRLPVSVASGTDSALLERLLIQAAEGSPGVLATPPPEVSAGATGAAASAYELAVWFHPSELSRQQLASHLNFAVHRVLREHGISHA